MRTLDLVGERYGLLTVLHRVGKSTGLRPEHLWLCKCDCGREKTVRQNNLRSGHTKSCGCQVVEINRNMRITHGMRRTDTYTCWCQMKARCTNPKAASYLRYGARGISVCERWLHSFENFLEDMGERPGKSYSIERLNNDKGYCPENCKWATRAEQARNYSRNVFVEHEGRKQCVADWAAEKGISVATLRHRIKVGWPVADALSIPVTLSNRSRINHGH